MISVYFSTPKGTIISKRNIHTIDTPIPNRGHVGDSFSEGDLKALLLATGRQKPWKGWMVDVRSDRAE